MCSQAEDFRKQNTEMRFLVLRKGYPKGLVENEMSKAKFSGYTRRNKREKKGVPFVISYHPSLKNKGRIISPNLYILYMIEDVKSVFTPAPMISFHSTRKLSSYLEQNFNL